MCLDMNALTLSYSVNGKDQGIAFRDIDQVQYKAAVYTYHRDECVQLIAYNQFE